MVHHRPLVKKASIRTPVLAGILVVLLIILIIVIINMLFPFTPLPPAPETGVVNLLESKRPSLTPSPSPVMRFRKQEKQPLPSGEQLYYISRGDDSVGPQLKQFTISNLATKINDPQKATVTAIYEYPIKSITLTLITDNKRTDYALHLVKSTNTGSTSEEVWEGQWKTNDSHENVYQALIIGDAGDKGKSSVVVTFR